MTKRTKSPPPKPSCGSIEQNKMIKAINARGLLNRTANTLREQR